MEATTATDRAAAPVAPAVLETSRLILDIFCEYALNKFDEAETRWQEGVKHFLAVIAAFVQAGTRVEACLPAFPFKSANKVYKVLGSLPDKAEELALDRLHQMCERIRAIYAPGARVTIISDGITYNDLLCISDQETWAYGEALRKMALAQGFSNIGFARMRDLLHVMELENLREITYVANCTNFRRLLLNTYGKADLDIDREIAENPDTKLTYLGYKRFLESDLQHIFPRGRERSANAYRRDCKYLAKQMLVRGYAFARAIESAFPHHLRLSIHESLGGHKVSISLLNTRTGFTTPWHCSVAQLADGTWISAPMGEFRKDARLELVEVDGRGSHFREKPAPSAESDTSATYLRPQRPLSISAYLSAASPSPSSRSESSRASRATTPEPMSSPSPSSSPLSSSLSPPPSDKPPYGQRLIPQIMDSLAAAEPNRIVFSLSTLVDDRLTLRHVSARHFARAVDKTAWWLVEQVGRPETIQPVGYIGPHDLRHILLTYACVKVGYAALFLSPKNNTEGALAVLEATQCSVWARAGDALVAPLVQEVLARRPMTEVVLPGLEELLEVSKVRPFAYGKTFAEARQEPFCLLHTSGTTGVPKPIPWSHGLIGTMDAVRLLPAVEGDGGLRPWTEDWQPGDRIYSAFPMSHGAGIIMDILMPALYGLQCVLGPAGVLPNVNLVATLAETAQIDIWSMVPSLVDEVGETAEVLVKLAGSKFICASGGPVSPVSAGKANEVVRVLNLTGTTEGLFIGNLVPPREDWFWFSFHPYAGFEFRLLEAEAEAEGEEETYEHWVHRRHSAAEEPWPLFQGIFHTFPDKSSINFKDLYRRHPTKPHLWAFQGRSDDLVVLSNGYKIAPLETEALVTTHPAIRGCLVFGTGRPQAGLLIELVRAEDKTDEAVLDSIWATVQRANAQSRHTNQLLRDFVTFAAPDRPFLRTDKGTVKRAATLARYADFIERFYSSRDDSVACSVSLDTRSVASIEQGLRAIFAATLADMDAVPADANLFERGLDSLGVFAAVKTLRAATGLGTALAPRHIYAHASIGALAAAVHRLAAEAARTGEAAAATASAARFVGDDVAAMQRAIAQHQARQSFRLNALDYVNPNHGMGLVFYLALSDGTTADAAFANLQAGLDRTLDMIPVLGGKIMRCSDQEMGYRPGDLCVTMPSPAQATTVHGRLTRQDLSAVLPSFAALRQAGFVPSAVPDHLVLRDDPFPALPADILVAQANFVEGGCLLAVELNHCCLDGLGVMVAMQAWADNCRFLQGDAAATCAWLHPESGNHSLPDILHRQEGWDQHPDRAIDPATWEFLPFFPPPDQPQAPYPLHSVWPLPPAARPLRTTLFAISADRLAAMKQDVLADPAAHAVITSASDIVQAFFWRAAIRARQAARAESVDNDALSILELPTDGRPYFSPLLPETYMGSLLLLNRARMPVADLCAPDTSIGRVAHLLRQAAARLTPALVHDAFSLLQALPDHSRFSTANMGLDHMHAMISNMMLFPLDAIRFGDAFFGHAGAPASMRPLLQRGNARFRFLVIFPMKPDGGVELVLGTHPEELQQFMADPEFTRYATLVDTSE